jgi:hypothetical protein
MAGMHPDIPIASATIVNAASADLVLITSPSPRGSLYDSMHYNN